MQQKPPIKNFRPGSACSEILLHLQNGGSVSSWDGEKFRCTSITQRIHDLRRAGHDIISVPKISKFGARYDEYRLALPVQPDLFGNATASRTQQPTSNTRHNAGETLNQQTQQP